MPLDSSRVDKPIRKLRKLLKKMATEPSPKQVHDLRTNSRRLEAMLEAIHPDRNGRKILKQISKVRKRAGKVRDMDVLTSYATGLSSDRDEEACSVQLLEHLGAVRQKKAKKLSRTAQQLAPELRKRLRRSSKNIDKNLKREPAEGTQTSSRITSSALQLLSDLEQPTHLNRANLHPYRLKVKELRNLLRLAETENEPTFVDTLGEVKDAIGEWHDWVELQAIAKEVLDHNQCGLMRELKIKAEERFQRALVITQRMRQKYLGRSKKKPASGRPTGPDESVWSAAAALAA
jgi:CHAD domain-containing protein